MAKRKSDSDKDYSLLPSDILESSPKAKVQCLVTALSDMKRSRNSSYFDGEISDGKTSMRLYGYNEGVRRKLEFMESSMAPVWSCF